MSTIEADIAYSLQAEIEAAAADAEDNCRLPTEMIHTLAERGLFAMVIPEQYGGTQRSARECMEMIDALSYIDSATGWCAMIYTTTAMLGSFLPEDWAKKVYGISKEGDNFQCPIGAGAAAPSGNGQVVDGGIRASGRWAWGSGSHHADWICGGTLVEKDGELVRHPTGDPAVHVLFFPKDEVKLHTNWNPSGLRGTGSVDFEVNDVFVPDGRWTILGASRRQVDATLYRFPFFGFFASAVACVPIGIARRAIDDFVDIAQNKVPVAASSTLATASIPQLRFGEAESLVLGAKDYLFSTIDRVWERIVETGKATEEDRRHLRLAATRATLMCTEAVDILYNAAGGTALQGDCSLQKHFRDIHAATQHRMVSPEILRMASAVRLTETGSPQL